MKVFVITQNDPFYLSENIDYLLNNLPPHTEIVGCCLFEASPFGKRETFVNKAVNTYKVFGWIFFIRYSLKFIANKLFNRKSVLAVLKEHNVDVVSLDESINSEKSLDKIKMYKPDLLVSIAGNQIFKRSLINLAPKGCLNLHTSLLPKYRGLLPSFWVLKNEETYSGVSVFFVDEGIDSGEILVQKKFEIGDMSQEQLIRLSKRMGMNAVLEAIDLVRTGKFDLIENKDEEMSYFSFPTRADVKMFKQRGKKFF
ncbi:MAG: formyltransferase family protein [Gammaproteobacteria bacterium]|nr:formyltransferase family protein [Gammaproteobacteria bacterium]